MQHERRIVNVRRCPSSRRGDASFTRLHRMTRSRFYLARDDSFVPFGSGGFVPTLLILSVRELFGVSLTLVTFLTECRLMEKVSSTAGAVCNGCLVYEQQGQCMVVLLDTPFWYAWL